MKVGRITFSHIPEKSLVFANNSAIISKKEDTMHARTFKKKCTECGNDFHGVHNQIYCSKKCYKSTFGLQSSYKNIAPGTVGAIQELRVSVDLLMKQWEVFRALSPSCSCDLLIQKNNKFLRVEVRTAYLKKNGKVLYPKQNITADILALVFPNEIIYKPELCQFNEEIR